MEIGSSVITQISSGIIVGATKTHWTIVGFDGRYEFGPLNVQELKRGGRYPMPFPAVNKQDLVRQLLDTYDRASPPTQKQKSELAHRLLLQHLGHEEIDMATAKKTPQPVKKAAPKAATKPEKKAAAPKAAAKPEKKAAAKPEKKEGSGRRGAFTLDMKIKVLAEKNPKRADAAKRFDLYKNGMSIGDYIAAGGTMADVRWDVKKQFISVA